VWPESAPLFLRISATDWIAGGWDLDQSIRLAALVGPLGVDLIDCSSGGLAPGARIPTSAGYQVPFADEIRRETGILTGAVGLITTAAQADAILREGKADVVLLAREFLRQPYWPLHVARELGFPCSWPAQYLRAAPDGTPQREALSLPELKRCMAEHHGIPEE
jgi:2,4-dienoyl-CoA reductase-like NADH-dependent reductase (Old Yellow Enzyme family)